MSRAALILLAFLTIPSGGIVAQVKLRVIESLGMNSVVLKQEVKYSVCLPKDYYTSNKRYPVVYLLHGLGDNESSWLEYGQVNQIADQLVQQNEIIPMIYIMPQGFRTYYVNDFARSFLYHDMFVNEFVPFIDAQYRTLADKDHRATMGYSMGGFGALILPLKNPDLFSVCVPLSISIRTDEQYKTEDASGWDDQWGKLFGGIGKLGDERLTAYYQQNSPFAIFRETDLSRISGLKIFVDNGDDEGTLSRSNEELHMLLRDKKYPHEFRVRNGGHEFSYWRAAMPNGFRFISDAFNGKPYRGDMTVTSASVNSNSGIELIDADGYSLYVPAEYASTRRLYPVVYCVGNFTLTERRKIANTAKRGFEAGSLPALIIVFVTQDEKHLKDVIIPSLEKNYRARPGFRFRALIGFGAGGETALRYASDPEQFTSCATLDAPLNCDDLKVTVSDKAKKSFSRTWLFIVAADKGDQYLANGCAHMTLKDADVYHEYRVKEGTGGNSWAMASLDEILIFTQNKIHR